MVLNSHAFVPTTFGKSSCESIVFLATDTYHMNVAFTTISLGRLLIILELKLINNILDSL